MTDPQPADQPHTVEDAMEHANDHTHDHYDPDVIYEVVDPRTGGISGYQDEERARIEAEAIGSTRIRILRTGQPIEDLDLSEE